jgi:hypothetical protein
MALCVHDTVHMQIHASWKIRFICLVLYSSAFVAALQPLSSVSPASLWQDRGDVSKLDMVDGPGGAAHQPGNQFQFLKESMNGTSPKFDVQDEKGIKWKVKLGEEARSETAATRLVWAAGYYVDEDYYRAEIHVDGMKPLTRGRKFVRDDGTVEGVRLERHRSGPDPMNWSWFENPFKGTKEFNGLRVVMALLNNWDLKEINNAVYVQSEGNIYVVADLGATFGRTGDAAWRSKGVSKDYAKAPFIEGLTEDHVDFTMATRPFFMGIFNPRHYFERADMSKVAKGIPIEDARWVGKTLGGLSAEQIADCFRSAGFSPSEVETYTQAVKQRIEALLKL